MSGKDQKSTRRTVLKSIGAGTIALSATGLSGIGASQTIPHKTLRGSLNDPVSTDEIESLREAFAKNHSQTAKGEPNAAFVDPAEAFGTDVILGYNIVSTTGTPKEQYVTANEPSLSVSTETDSQSVSGTESTESRLHQKADELLSSELETSQTNGVTTMASDQDWENWNPFGSTDVYYEGFDPDSDYGVKPGIVEFVIDIRRSPDDPRIGARSKLRMEPGRQVCNSETGDYKDYCSGSTVQTGWRNRNSVVYHDWDYSVNDTPTDDLIVGLDPEGQISDVTGTRSASLNLNLAREPSLSVGYSSGVSFPGAQLVEQTTKRTGRAKYKFKVNKSTSPSAKNTAVFEVGSTARYETSGCGDFYREQYFGFDSDFLWSFKNPTPGIDWVNETRDSKSFSYYTYC